MLETDSVTAESAGSYPSFVKKFRLMIVFLRAVSRVVQVQHDCSGWFVLSGHLLRVIDQRWRQWPLRSL